MTGGRGLQPRTPSTKSFDAEDRPPAANPHHTATTQAAHGIFAIIGQHEPYDRNAT
jgi:hypothetical protein